MPPVDQDVMQAEISSIKESMGEVKGTLSKMADALERLARLEERHANMASAVDRAFSTISKIELRVSKNRIESARPEPGFWLGP